MADQEQGVMDARANGEPTSAPTTAGDGAGRNVKVKIEARDLSVFYDDVQAIKEATLQVYEREIMALMGPSGCGKSTFLRCFNRMNDVIPSCRVEGEVLLEGENLYDRSIDPVIVRARVGMVPQSPNPFPKSIYDNLAFGPRIHGLVDNKSELDELVESSLRRAGLWDEVKDNLGLKGNALSGGQQQRLVIARAIANRPEVILMDEPCSSLDPRSTEIIEGLMRDLANEYSIIVVTHNMQQAERVADRTAMFHLGDLVEVGETSEVFRNPKDDRTKDYVGGQFG